MRRGQFERLYAEHAQRLFGFLVYRTGDRGLAEDLLADTFEAAYRARSRYDPRRASEHTWLYAIALNLLRDHLRREGARTRAYERVGSDGRPGAEDPALAGVEDRDQLVRAMERLSDEEREALALRYGADLGLKEIAATLEVPMTTAEGRVYRALEKLRGAI